MFAHAARRFDVTSAGCVALALAALLTGACVYFVARPWLQPGAPAWLTTMLGVAPTFLHVLAFALLAAAVEGATLAAAAQVSVTWVLVNLLFEVGQHDEVASLLARSLDALCGSMSACEATAAYFTRGRFDGGDLAAAVAGGFAAYGFLRWMGIRQNFSGESR